MSKPSSGRKTPAAVTASKPVAKSPAKPRKTGTQTIERVLHLLRLMTRHEANGLPLADIIEETGLERSTAYRFMNCLVEERFLWRDPATRHYHLGIDAMQMGLVALDSSPVSKQLMPLAKRLARLSGDTVFLVVQQGDHCLCLLREHSDFPVRIFTVSPGEKRLLGLGAGGLALLAKRDDEDIMRAYSQYAQQYQAVGMNFESLMADVRLTREAGYSQIVDGITTGVSGVGYAFAVSGMTMAAISFGAINARLDASRRREMGRLLIDECTRWVAQL